MTDSACLMKGFGPLGGAESTLEALASTLQKTRNAHLVTLSVVREVHLVVPTWLV